MHKETTKDTDKTNWQVFKRQALKEIIDQVDQTNNNTFVVELCLSAFCAFYVFRFWFFKFAALVALTAAAFYIPDGPFNSSESLL